jgi:hypothetical protein
MIYLLMKRELVNGVNCDSVVQAYTDYDVAKLFGVRYSQNTDAKYYVSECELNDEDFMSEPIADEGVSIYAGLDEVIFFYLDIDLETVWDGGWDYLRESPGESKRYELNDIYAYHGISLDSIGLSDSAVRMIKSDAEGIMDKINDEI